MSLALSKAARLKPELRLAQALSEYEAILCDEHKAKLRGYRAQSPPTAADVMQLTAEIDHDAVRGRRFKRCVGPRLCNFLQAVQGFTGVVDTLIGGSQSMAASAIWGAVKLSLQLASAVSSYFDQLSELFMSIGRSCPRNGEYVLLYPRSPKLKEAVHEYFIVIVQLCKHVVLFLDRPLLRQLLSASMSLVTNEFDSFQLKLERLATTVKEEISLASAHTQAQDSEENSKFRYLSLASSAQNRRWRRHQTELQFLHGCSIYNHQVAWKQTRKSGNVEWFLEEQAYIRWKAEAVSSVLHCTGALGSGKSVLSANVVDDLALCQSPFCVAYFFCKYDDVMSLSARTIIGSIARQILELLRPDMISMVSEINAYGLDTEGIIEILLAILSSISHQVPNLAIVLDGIDECQESDARSTFRCLRRLTSSKHITKLFCSSRQDVLLWATEALLPDHVLSMSASRSSDEMIQYVERTLEDAVASRRLCVGDIRIVDIIRDTLLKNAHGMYLWVTFQIDAICFEQTDQDILNALEDLPRDLPGTFNRILVKLRSPRTSSSGSSSPVNVFRLVAAARRPLTLDELREAISVVPGVITWDPKKVVNDIQKLLGCCGSLLVVDEEDYTVRFTHQSVQQFLCSDLVSDIVKEFKLDLPSADLDMGNICVTYLNSERHNAQLVKPPAQKLHPVASSAMLSKTIPSSTFAGKLAIKLLRKRPNVKHDLYGSLEDDSFLDSTSENLNQLHYSFLVYAQRNWLWHTKKLTYTRYPDAWPLWKRLVTGMVHTAQLPWAPENCLDLDRKLIEWVLEHQQWNIVYMIVAHVRHHASEELLLRLRALNMSPVLATTTDPSFKSFLEPFVSLDIIKQFNEKFIEQSLKLEKVSPLYIASSLGYVESVRQLLDHGADTDFDNNEHGTALQVACQSEKYTVVELLIERGANINLHCSTLGTALHVASGGANTRILKLLLDRGADVNVLGGHHHTAIHAAFHTGNFANLELLLEAGADPNAKGEQFGTVMVEACEEGNEGVVELLVRYRADCNTVFLASCCKGNQSIVKLLLKGGVNVNTALQAACRFGWEQVVKLLLERGADVNVQCGQHGSALHAAYTSGNDEVVRLLVQSGADVNIEDWMYGSALQRACVDGRIEIVKFLVQSGADLSIQCGQFGTALHAACTSGNEEVVTLLVQSGADVNVQGGKYGTVLQAACNGGNEEIVKLLVQSGADVNMHDGFYGTALHRACDGGRIEIVRLLVQNGADVNIQNELYGTALQRACVNGHLHVVELLVQIGADVQMYSGKYGTALQAACTFGQEEIVKLLLDEGADVNVKGGEYGTALHAACQVGREQIVNLLLESGADVNTQGGEYGTPLQAACVPGNEGIVKLLLKNGADVNGQGGKHGTALQAACAYGLVEIGELLLQSGADVNMQGGKYGTALQRACVDGRVEVFNLLLVLGGADVNMHCGMYGTALQAACRFGRENFVKLLLEKGADVTMQGGEYGTALQAACTIRDKGAEKTVKLLLRSGADVNIQGGVYGTALQAACRSGCEESVKLLLEKGADVNVQGGKYGTALQAAEEGKRRSGGFSYDQILGLLEQSYGATVTATR